MKHVFLLGDPVEHSLSPEMQNAAFGASGLDWQYELLRTPRARLKETVARLRQDDCAGANVTVPHKEAVVEFLDDLTDHARKIGAVNTIVNRDGKLLGENTDVHGFTQALRESSVELRGARAVILGAGGAARAAVFALAIQNAERITIMNRTESRAQKLADDARAQFPKLAVEVNSVAAFATAHLIVNATSVGMSPNANASPMQWLFPRGAAAIDLVYRPLQTQFLREAERAGARPIGGVTMLVHQGAAAFTLWTGRDAPVELMLDATVKALRNL
jgi:shikimate dehydrogenase